MGSFSSTARVISEFTKTTLIGGLLVVVPIYLSVILLLKMLAGVGNLISPVTSGLPTTLPFRQLIAILAILLVCLLCGAAVRTRPGRWAKGVLENSFLEKIPGYTLMRGLAGRVAGREEEKAFAVVLAEIEDALVPAFLVEDCADGLNCTIFVPSVPTPAAGAIYIIPKTRVHAVNVPFTRAVSVISKWGAGASELLANMKKDEQKAA